MQLPRQEAGNPAQEGPPEQRRSERRRVLKGATISFNRGFSAYECVVRNRSAGGAMIIINEGLPLPSRFAISIAGEAAAHEAEVRWRCGAAAGLYLMSGGKA